MTTTRVERIAISTGDATTYYTSDADLFVKLRRGQVTTSGDMLGAVLIRLGIDEDSLHEVIP